MHRIFYGLLTASFLGLSLEHNTLFEGYDLSLSGYHLCTETMVVNSTKVMSYKTSYTEKISCGGWLPWKMCQRTVYKTTYKTVFVQVTKETTRCCDGYEQVGSYCALPLSRSAEFTAKPGACPKESTGTCGAVCEWDIDCPGWQKCCRMEGHSCCTDTKAEDEDRGWCLHVIITVKTDYQEVVSMHEGILNHTRLLHAMVTGSLECSDCSVFYLHSRQAGPFTTASELLIGSPRALSLNTTASQLHLLLKHIEEVSSVEVQDMDECTHEELNNCSPDADCLNTEGSYHCSCRPGFTDLSSNHTGVYCKGSQNLTNITNGLLPSPNNSTWTSCGHSDRGLCPWDGTNNITFTNTSSNHSMHLQTWINERWVRNDSYTELPTNDSHMTPTHTSGPELLPNITDGWDHKASTRNSDITSHSVEKTNITRVSEGLQLNSTDVLHVTNSPTRTTIQRASSEANSMMILTSSEPNSTMVQASSEPSGDITQAKWSSMAITPHAAPSSTSLEPLRISSTVQTIERSTSTVPPVISSAKTSTSSAQTLRGMVRLTNVDFSTAFLNSSSEDYLNLTQNIEREIIAGLSPDIQDLVYSGAVRIQITGLSPGSVVVNFVMVFSLNGTKDITNVSWALMQSLENSSIYTVDSSRSSIDDFDECLSGIADCSPFAVCENNWGSYTCTCKEGFTDTSRDRKGQSCTAWTTTVSTPSSTSPSTTTVSSTTTISSTTTVSSTTANSLKTTSSASLAPVISQAEAIIVECRASEISVSVAKEFLRTKFIEESSLYLGRPECGVTDYNTSHVQLTVTWGQCGTIFQHNTTHNSAQVTLFNNRTSGSLITPKVLLEIPVVCTYRNSILISTGYAPTGYDMIKDVVEGSGTFHVTVQILNGTYPLPQNYSLSPNEEVVVEVAINSTLEQIKLVINECWATPTSNPSDMTTYFFLKNSCPIPDTYTTVLQNGNSSTSRLALRIFSFVEQSVIYLHCQIQICFETAEATCRPDCTSRTQRSINVVGIARASCGPIYKALDGSTKDITDAFPQIAAIILGVGVSILILGVLSLVFYRKRRVGHYNFNLKPNQERFTYHVFDT